MKKNIIPIGAEVKVIKQLDDTCLPEHIGKIGEVVRLNTNEETGNTKKDPLYIVRFNDGSGEDSFWFEELSNLSKSRAWDNMLNHLPYNGRFL